MESITSIRLTAGPLELTVRALGDRRAVATKLRRIASTAALYVRRREIPDRLDRLRDAGYAPRTPTRAQLWFGGLDMVRYVIVPAARDYYQAKTLPGFLSYCVELPSSPLALALRFARRPPFRAPTRRG